MPDSEHFETFGVPTYYVNVAIPESAGGGNVRVWNCARRRGILVPQCEIIIPAIDLVMASRAIADAANKIFEIESTAVRKLAS